MISPSSDSLLWRIVRQAGRFAALLIGFIVFVLVFTLLFSAVAVLHLTRPFVYYPLAAGVLGGVVFGGYFAYAGSWSDAGSAFLLAVICGAILAVYSFVAEKLDPDFFQPRLPWRY